MFNQRQPFNATTMVKHYKNNPSQLFNIFASHSSWNLDEVKRSVGIDAKIITILRDPLEVFESGYVYFGFEKFLNLNINQFAAKIVQNHSKRPKNYLFGKNQLLYNLGLPVKDMEDKTLILRYLQSNQAVLFFLSNTNTRKFFL